MDMCDEGDFLMLDATPWPASTEAGRWLIYMGNDPETGPVGWTVSVDDHDVPLGVAVEVSVEQLASEPPLPSNDFDDVVEVSVMGGAVLSGGNEDLVVVPSTAETHRVRVARQPGRGASPSLLIQAWPCAPEPASVVRGPATDPVPETPELDFPEAARGLRGAARIGNDIDRGPGARSLSGRLGVAEAHVVVRGRPASVCDSFYVGNVWTPDREGYAPVNGVYRDEERRVWYTSYLVTRDHPDQLSGWHGAICTLRHPSDSPPGVSALWWRWVRAVPPHERVTYEEVPTERFPPQDSVRLVFCTPAENEAGHTMVRVEHRDVPQEWVADLSDWWAFQLAILRHDFSEQVGATGN